jgi:hypothetical protein
MSPGRPADGLHDPAHEGEEVLDVLGRRVVDGDGDEHQRSAAAPAKRVSRPAQPSGEPKVSRISCARSP